MTGSPRKRVKTGSVTEVETKAEEMSAPPQHREPNRLQKAKSRNRKDASGRKVTIAQARRIKKAEGQLGILSALPEAPVEIFCEIASYFSPQDLLSLSMVSRELREFLLSKNSRRLWIACLSTTTLPPCPEDLNEPQYVFMVYDTSCNACDAPYVKSVCYELRLRLCKSCFEINRELMSKHYMLGSRALDLIPNFRQQNAWHKYYYEPDYVTVAQELDGIKDENERQEYCKKRRKHVEGILQSAQHLRDWEKSKALQRKAELSDMKKEFTQGVIEKLKEIGYTEKDWSSWYRTYKSSDLKDQWYKLVVQNKVLTPRTWKNLLPKLQDLINSNRALQDEAERARRSSQRVEEFRKAYMRYTSHLCLASGEVSLMPCSSDLLEFPAIADSVKYDDCRRIFTYDLLESLLPTIIEAQHAHRQRVLADHEKATRWHRANKEQKVDVDNLRYIYLASSFFATHASGSNSMYYFHSSEISVLLVGAPRSEFHKASCYCPASGWSERYPWFHHVYNQLAEILLANLNISSTATMASMLAMGDCFVCDFCDEAFQEPLGWVDLVRHYIKERDWELSAERKALWKTKGAIKILKAHATEKEERMTPVVSARKLEGNELILAKALRGSNEKSKSKKCAICESLEIGFLMTDEQVTAHIRKVHGKVADSSEIIDSPINT